MSYLYNLIKISTKSQILSQCVFFVEVIAHSAQSIEVHRKDDDVGSVLSYTNRIPEEIFVKHVRKDMLVALHCAEWF